MSAELVRARIDEGPVAPLMWLVILLGFLLNLADGIDVVAMSVTAPSVAKAWGLERSMLGPLFSSALFGMAIGAAGLAPLSDRLGRRLLLVSAMFLVGLSMIAVRWIAHTESVAVFALLRFVSGLGIGVIFGCAPALASEFMPLRFKSLAVSLVVMGYPVGAILAGPMANALIPQLGWTAVFTAGGLITLTFAGMTWALLPESPEFLASQRVFALMHLDLDRFKLVNDTFGHAAGDHVLQHAARIMLAQTRKEDAVLRVGGDEFILIFPGVTDLATLDAMAYRLIRALEKPIESDGRMCQISGSVGITLATDYAIPAAPQLLADADKALYAAKNAGGAQHRFFSKL